MVSLKQIEEFLATEPIALIGVSRSPKKFGFIAFRELKEKGMNIIPVNPYASEIHGIKAYPDIKSLPADVKGIIIMTKKEQTEGLVREAKEKGIKQIWIQPSSDSENARNELSETDINYIYGQCILKHYKPHSIHKFHGRVNKFFGRFPR
ncbi:MAG TPA: CoA-binding protein [Bacteroidales bacterium]|nr:CoA-binding protein [Bacteroidales bacterium]HPT22335.1 CoA-binding protein [Bacteroidales bacterium]